MNAVDMIHTMGKKGFVDTVMNSQKNGQTGAQRERGIKGRIKYRQCEHRVWVIDNYEYKGCEKCDGKPKQTKAKDFRAGFNVGLGCWVNSRSEEKRIAKGMGLVEAG